MSTTDAVQVHASNAEQLRAWDGDEGAYWAAQAEHFDRAISEYHRDFLQACAIADAERVLDIGCGTGQTTRDAARAATAGAALGVDLSSAMLEYARLRTADEGIANAHFAQVDAQIHPWERATFDVAISRTGAMFFGDPIAAFTNIARAVRPGGRLVLLTWQSLAHNEWIREFSGALAAGRDLPAPPETAPGPFSLSDPERVRNILTNGGFTNIELEPATAGMWFGTDADDAYRFVLGLLGWMLDGLDDIGRDRALAALRATTADHETDGGVSYDSAAWIIRAVRP
jgi:SAM-dependent methyltransferase